MIAVGACFALAACGAAATTHKGSGSSAPSAARGTSPASSTAAPDPSAPVAAADYGSTLSTRRQAMLSRGQSVSAGDVGYYMDTQEARFRQLAGPSIRLSRRGTSVYLELPGPLNFDVGSANPSARARSAIASVAKVLSDYRFTLVSVEGHTDDSGDAAANRVLSEQRASAVAKLLIADGVDPERIVVVGYGSDKPIGDNSTETGREANRRVVLRIDPLERDRARSTRH